MSHRLVSISLVGIAALMISVSIFFTQQSAQQPTQTKSGYDAFAEQLHQTQYDKYGMRNSVFTSPKLKHYIVDGHTLIFRPHIIMHNKKGIWNVTADTATTMKNNTIIHLKGHVTITQPATTTSPATRIKTTYATVYPRRSFAKTQDYVTINRASTTITGQGATADMKQGIIKLLSHTRGHYVPAPHS